MAIWRALQELLAGALAFFFTLVPSYGMAIILLTVAVNLVLFPLTLKQVRSMRAMQELQPEVKKLQKEFKDDKQKMQEEMMNLYRERGVNPAAGCLPLVFQAPIWFALFTVLRTPLEFASIAGTPLGDAIRANGVFLGMELDLSPSQVFSQQGILPLFPYLVLIAIVVASGYYQQKQATSGGAGDQQSPMMPQMQMVTKVMPIMFGVFSWTFPTGLVLYFASSNTFRIGQQAFIFWLERTDPKAAAEEQEAEQEAEPPPQKPKPRKRKRKKK